MYYCVTVPPFFLHSYLLREHCFFVTKEVNSMYLNYLIKSFHVTGTTKTVIQQDKRTKNKRLLKYCLTKLTNQQWVDMLKLTLAKKAVTIALGVY